MPNSVIAGYEMSKRMLIIRTGRIGEPEVIDTTVKSSTGIGRFFAPSWEIVGGHKRWAAERAGEQPPSWTLKYAAIDDEQYVAAYKQLLRARWKQYAPELRNWLQGKSVVTLACYCSRGKFCHRDEAAKILLQIAQSWGIDAKIE